MINGVGFNAASSMFTSFAPGNRHNVNSWGLGGNVNMGGLGGLGANNFLPPATSNFIVAARTSAEGLRTALSQLVGRDSAPTFAPRNATSADEDVLRIGNVNANRVTNGNDIRVTVEQVAQAQQNEGAAMQATARAAEYGFEVGQNRIELQVGNRIASFGFEVRASDTVRDVQQRVANAVNNANLGVNATVTTTDGNSRLTFESASTGVTRDGQPNFEVRDITGNAAAMTGVDEITTDAQNAQFRVGFQLSDGSWLAGSLRESRSNDVDIGNGVTAQLRGEGVTDVSFTQDLTGLQNVAREMVNNFNLLFEAAMDNSGDRRTNSLFTRMEGLLSTHASSLSRVGININANGFLAIDADRMRTAAESGALEQFFQGNGNQQSFGFANRLSRIAEDVANNPERFVSGATASDGFGVDFGGANAGRANAFFNNRMNHFMGMGMLFDLMF